MSAIWISRCPLLVGAPFESQSSTFVPLLWPRAAMFKHLPFNANSSVCSWGPILRGSAHCNPRFALEYDFRSCLPSSATQLPALPDLITLLVGPSPNGIMLRLSN